MLWLPDCVSDEPEIIGFLRVILDIEQPDCLVVWGFSAQDRMRSNDELVISIDDYALNRLDTWMMRD